MEFVHYCSIGFDMFQLSGQHLNIGKIFGASPESTDLQEKFIQKVTFSPQKNVILSTKFSIYILHTGYTQNLYKCSVHIYLRHCVNKLQNTDPCSIFFCCSTQGILKLIRKTLMLV